MDQQPRDVSALRREQIATLARLGRLRRNSPDFQEFADAVVVAVRDVFAVAYCKVLELLPDGKEMLLRAGVGWLPGLVGAETVGTDWQSQAGYTLLKKQPIIVTDLNRERRFSGSALLHAHRVVSGVNTIIPGAERPWGVIGVHSTRAVPFDETDAAFLTTVAEFIGLAAQHVGGAAREHGEATG